MRLYNLIFNYYFTFCSWIVFSAKSIIDELIGAMLGFLISVQDMGDDTPMRKLYIIGVLFSILMIFSDKFIRKASKTFDLWKTLTKPVNVGQEMKKVINYSRRTHFLQTFSLIMFEILKIGAIVYCIITLATDVKERVFLYYVLFGMLLVNSFLGLMLYIPMALNILIVKNFYYKQLSWFSDWYLKRVIRVNVEKTGDMISIEFGQLDVREN